jgi:hypothetical protein
VIDIKRDSKGKITSIRVSEGFGFFLFFAGIMLVVTFASCMGVK